jgi:hypothetical protein
VCVLVCNKKEKKDQRKSIFSRTTTHTQKEKKKKKKRNKHTQTSSWPTTTAADRLRFCPSISSTMHVQSSCVSTHRVYPWRCVQHHLPVLLCLNMVCMYVFMYVYVCVCVCICVCVCVCQCIHCVSLFPLPIIHVHFFCTCRVWFSSFCLFDYIHVCVRVCLFAAQGYDSEMFLRFDSEIYGVRRTPYR